MIAPYGFRNPGFGGGEAVASAQDALMDSVTGIRSRELVRVAELPDQRVVSRRLKKIQGNLQEGIYHGRRMARIEVERIETEPEMKFGDHS